MSLSRMVNQVSKFTKGKVRVIAISILIICSVGLICTLLKSPQSLAVEITDNSYITEDTMRKINNLTNGKAKIAYLTFDDGPNISVTPKILDILKKENIKATFFVIGKHVQEHPEIVKRAYEEGHYIANHGYDHNNKNMYKSEESFMNEIKKTDEEIGKAIGVENYSSHVFRFPNGFMSSQNKAKKKEAVQILYQMEYTYIDWNCLNNDSVKKYTKEQLINNLKKSCKNKETLVILMHDTKDVNNSSLVLEESIQYLKEQGYQFENFYNIMQNENDRS